MESIRTLPEHPLAEAAPTHVTPTSKLSTVTVAPTPAPVAAAVPQTVRVPSVTYVPKADFDALLARIDNYNRRSAQKI